MQHRFLFWFWFAQHVQTGTVNAFTFTVSFVSFRGAYCLVPACLTDRLVPTPSSSSGYTYVHVRIYICTMYFIPRQSLRRPPPPFPSFLPSVRPSIHSGPGPGYAVSVLPIIRSCLVSFSCSLDDVAIDCHSFTTWMWTNGRACGRRWKNFILRHVFLSFWRPLLALLFLRCRTLFVRTRLPEAPIGLGEIKFKRRCPDRRRIVSQVALEIGRR